MIDYKNVKYIVNLINGDITFSSRDYSTKYYRHPGPYKYCDNLYVADLYSLNILRQNFLEDREKKGADRPAWTSSFLRSVLGESDENTYQEVLDSIEFIQKNYPEYLL